MTRDIIVSRQCSVGPGFMHGAGKGKATISLDFFRPRPAPDLGPDAFPAWQCNYEIRHGNDAPIHGCGEGMDAVGALLTAMRRAVTEIDLAEWGTSIPKAYLDDMRSAGATPA